MDRASLAPPTQELPRSTPLNTSRFSQAVTKLSTKLCSDRVYMKKFFSLLLHLFVSKTAVVSTWNFTMVNVTKGVLVEW